MRKEELGIVEAAGSGEGADQRRLAYEKYLLVPMGLWNYMSRTFIAEGG